MKFPALKSGITTASVEYQHYQDADLIKLDALPAMVAPLLLADLFDRCASMSAALAETFAIRLAFPAGVAIRIETDGERLQHALLIVIENAIKYNRAGGSVCIDCTLPEAGKVCITVSDTGPGLDNEQLAGLFQPFSRLGQEASVIAGSGIGLHLAQGLLASLGGDIRADSAVGVGSVFTLTLPIASPVTGLDCVEPG